MLVLLAYISYLEVNKNKDDYGKSNSTGIEDR